MAFSKKKSIDHVFLVNFINNYHVRIPDKSGELIDKDNQVCGYQLTLSEHDYSSVFTYLLGEYVRDEDIAGLIDSPPYIIIVTPLQLEIILDYVNISSLNPNT